MSSEPGAPPVSVRGHKTSSTSILVTWGEVPPDKQHGKIIYYTVIYKKNESSTEKSKIVTTKTAKLENLERYTPYSIKVLATTIKGDGPPSIPIIVWTDQDGKCTYSPQWLNPESFRINVRKFCPTVLGCCFWNGIPLSICNQPTRKLVRNLTGFILLSINNSNIMYLFTIRLLFVFILK